MILLAILMCAIVAARRPADTINVPGDYPTIQAAINAASPGDVVVVAPGEYVESISLLGKPITLRSTDPTDPNIVAETIINGDGAYHVVQCVDGEGPDTILSGFTITGGNASGIGEDRTGGGMYCLLSSPTVSNCTFTGNRAFEGGAMMNQSSDPAVTGCTFSVNAAEGGGGGGMCNRSSSPTVRDSVFWGNRGTGMLNRDSSSPLVTDCVFASNSAKAGGGMLNHASKPSVANCVFAFNFANIGGGMHNSSSSPVVSYCTFIRNSATAGGAIYDADSTPLLTDCSFAGNNASSDGAMQNEASSPTLKNCILWGDNVSEIENHSSSPIVVFRNVQGGHLGEGNIELDPIFVDDPGTPDTGIGHPCVDMGAYEFQLTPCSADVGGDGTGNVLDLRTALAMRRAPSAAEDFSGHGVVNVLDMLEVLGQWGPCP